MKKSRREKIREKTKEKLIKKYGQTFLMIPQLRKEGATLKEIGQKLGVSREQVRQFLEKYFP